MGGVAQGIYKILLVVGSFACAMAFHNAASRYIYAIGREAPWAGVRNTVGATHPVHRSPAVASWIQSGITFVLILLFFFSSRGFRAGRRQSGRHPIAGAVRQRVQPAPLMGTAMILIVQTICSLAVIWFFAVKKVHPGNPLWTVVAPAIGGLGMLYALYLLWTNRDFAAGYGSDSLVFKLMPVYVVLTLVLGLGYTLWLRRAHPETYNEVGRTVQEEAHERA